MYVRLRVMTSLWQEESICSIAQLDERDFAEFSLTHVSVVPPPRSLVLLYYFLRFVFFWVSADRRDDSLQRFRLDCPRRDHPSADGDRNSREHRRDQRGHGQLGSGGVHEPRTHRPGAVSVPNSPPWLVLQACLRMS